MYWSFLKKVFTGFIFVLVAVMFVLFFSVSTTPLLSFSIEGDSATFQTIGKYWVQGKIPYIDLWDHKGPIIFFINALGYWMTDSKVGVCLIQVIALIITEFFAYKIYRSEFSKKYAIALTIVTVLALSLNYSEGNGTEEYALPLLMVSYYCMLRWCDAVQNKQMEHQPKWAILYGACFSFCLLTRVTNAVGICIGVAFISINLVLQRKWRNLFENAVMFITGFLLVAFPFFAYFEANHCLDEMWYGTITYNMQYADHSGFQWKQTVKENLELLLGFSNCIGLLFTGFVIIFLNKRQHAAGVLWALIATSTLVLLASSNNYLHYGIIALPYFCISVVEMHKMFIACEKGSFLRKVTLLASVGFIIFGVASGFFRIKNLKGVYHYYITRVDDLTIYQKIPAEDRDSFVAYNGMNNIYLEMDSCPYYRFFILQDWQAGHSDSLEKEIYDTFSEGDVKWILATTYDNNCGIQKVLDKKYECFDVEKDPFLGNEYKLYCRLDSN